MNQISKDIFLWQLCLNLLVWSMHWSLYELEALVGGGCPQNILLPYFLRHSFFLHHSLPFTSFPHPSSLWGTDDVRIFFEEMWEVCHPLPTWCGLHVPEENNHHQQCKRNSSTAREQSTHWLLKSYHVTWQGDNTHGTGQGLGGPVKHTLPFQENIPSGNNLAFPAKHELAWQSDQLITPVHLIPCAWLITITSPRTEWIQLQ